MDSKDIENVQFTVSRFKGGYDQEEVDNFLDRVAMKLENTEVQLGAERDKVAQLKREIAEANRKLAEFGEAPTMSIPMDATRILHAAQRTADDVINVAKTQAKEIENEALQKSVDLVNEAGAEADAKRRAIEAHCHKAEEKIEGLRAKHEQLRLYLKHHLTSSLEELDGFPKD
ncbi:MAG: DivIVA domain-containing protein [Gemmatimonadaceae bacterium]|nr:DivIVA domain-containing protein [Actinomycetota bacterium]